MADALTVRMFDFLTTDSHAQIICPVCGGVPHLQHAEMSRPEGSSGNNLQLGYSCEEGHQWIFATEDHSGATWLSVEILK